MGTWVQWKDQLKSEDHIFIVHGSAVPLILRDAHGTLKDIVLTEGRYSLICRAYVHGIMDGEIADAGAAKEMVVELV
jgi:hypothetical protein